MFIPAPYSNWLVVYLFHSSQEQAFDANDFLF